jgi:hypothetical protein
MVLIRRSIYQYLTLIALSICPRLTTQRTFEHIPPQYQRQIINQRCLLRRHLAVTFLKISARKIDAILLWEKIEGKSLYYQGVDWFPCIDIWNYTQGTNTGFSVETTSSCFVVETVVFEGNHAYARCFVINCYVSAAEWSLSTCETLASPHILSDL